MQKVKEMIPVTAAIVAAIGLPPRYTSEGFYKGREPSNIRGRAMKDAYMHIKTFIDRAASTSPTAGKRRPLLTLENIELQKRQSCVFKPEA